MNILCRVLCLTLLASVQTNSYGDTTKGQVFSWPTIPPKSIGWDIDKFAQLEADIHNKELAKITSVLVAHKGKLIYQAYFNNGHVDYMNVPITDKTI